MQKNKFITALLAAGLIGFGGSAHAFGLGLLAAGVASYFGWGASSEASGDAAEGDGQKSGGMGMVGVIRGFLKSDTKGDAATRADQRLVRIKSDLNPSAEQEPLWNDFAEKTRLEAAAGKKVRELRSKAREEKLAAPEYMERSQAALKDQLTAHAAATDSFRLFYAALTPEQKLAADRHLLGSAAKSSGEAPAAQSPGQPVADTSASPGNAGGG